jgi:hypothetical protein
MGRGNKHPLKKFMGGWGPRSTLLRGLADAQVGMSTIENVNLIKCRKHNFLEKYKFSKPFVNLFMYMKVNVFKTKKKHFYASTEGNLVTRKTSTGLTY